MDDLPLPGMAGPKVKRKPPEEAASMTQVSRVGPWGGIEDLFFDGEGLPRSPASILKLAREHGWGFGPITLVFRMNHPDPEIPRFFMGWRYDIPTGRWSYDGGRDQNMHPLTVSAVKYMLPLANLGGETRLLDPDCRDGKHSACIGDPCQCSCHLEEEEEAA